MMIFIFHCCCLQSLFEDGEAPRFGAYYCSTLHQGFCVVVSQVVHRSERSLIFG